MAVGKLNFGNPDFLLRLHPRGLHSRVLYKDEEIRSVKSAKVHVDGGGIPILTLEIYGAKVEMLPDSFRIADDKDEPSAPAES